MTEREATSLEITPFHPTHSPHLATSMINTRNRTRRNHPETKKKNDKTHGGLQEAPQSFPSSAVFFVGETLFFFQRPLDFSQWMGDNFKYKARNYLGVCKDQDYHVLIEFLPSQTPRDQVKISPHA